MSREGPRVPAAPAPAQLDRLAGVFEPLTRLTQPEIVGLDRVPRSGALFVGNHTLFGFLDLPFMIAELWKRKGVTLRGLGEHAHYAIPVWWNLLEMCGMVRGTRDNVRELMRNGENVLVFPGGTGEVFKERDQKYQLLWKERLGFAKLAIESGYPIVPFAAVGAEEMYDVIADRHTPGYAQLSGIAKRLVGVPLPPLPRGMGPTLLPRPERLYFWFGDPIETTALTDDELTACSLRDAVKTSVQTGIEILQRKREEDPKRRLSKRVMRGRPRTPDPASSDPNARFVLKAFEAWNVSGSDGAAAWMSRWVQLTDPPGWPGGRTWRGRDVVLRRLAEVGGELGADRVERTDARSVGDCVIAKFEVPGNRDTASARLEFHAVVEVQDAQIVKIKIFVKAEDAEAEAGRISRGR
ncbi:MAG: 1-acyl-sn-glycerol-3-phosphate acyltransferase [Solirubrobacterales bacterium]